MLFKSSAIVEEMVSYMMDGRVWPTGRQFNRSEWQGPSDEEKWQISKPVEDSWEPDVKPDHVLRGEDVVQALREAERINAEHGGGNASKIILPIEHTRIIGPLQCLGGNFSTPIHFQHCLFEDGINLRDCHLRLISLKYCKTPFISLKRAEIDRSVIIEYSYVTAGINLRAAEIGGLLGLKGSRLHDGGNKFRALDARNANIGSSAFLRYGFLSRGFVDLTSAHIKGNLDCGKAAFSYVEEGASSRPIALRAKGCHIEGSVYLNRDFSGCGEVDFRRSIIKGQATIEDATLDAGPKEKGVPSFALNFENADIGQDLRLSAIKSLTGDIGLQNAAVRTFADMPDDWINPPKSIKGKFWLSGFKYASLTRTKGHPNTRRKWLKAVLPKHYLKTFIRQPWEQMASVLKDNGEHEAADILLVEADDRSLRNLIKSSGLFITFFACIYYLFMRSIRFGYGFGYARIVGFLAVLWFINVLIFGLSAGLGRMKPAEEEVNIYMEKEALTKTPQYYMQFNSLVYALDVIVPVELGQQNKWTPMTAKEPRLVNEEADFVTRGLMNWSVLRPFLDYASNNLLWFPKVWGWLNICFGWLSFILIGASFAGRFRHD